MMKKLDELYEKIERECKHSDIIEEAWTWKHPLTFDAKSQEMNELVDKLKSGEVKDTVVIKLDKWEFVGEAHSYVEKNSMCFTGEMFLPKGVEIDADWSLLLPEEIGSFSINRDGKAEVITYWDKGWKFEKEWKFGDTWDPKRKLPKDIECLVDGKAQYLKLVWWITADISSMESGDEERSFEMMKHRISRSQRLHNLKI